MGTDEILCYIHFIDFSVNRMLASREYTSEEKIFAYKTLEKLYKLFLYDRNYGYEHIALHGIWRNVAEEYAKCKDAEKTVNALKTAYSHAFEMDHFKSGSYTVMFADTRAFFSDGVTKNFETSHIDWLMNTMEKPVFDFVRDTEGFQKIIAAGRNDLALEL